MVLINKVTCMGNNKKGQIVVTLGENDVIYCELTGFISGDMVTQSTKETAQYLTLLRQKGRKAHLLIDLSGVIEQSSEARIEAKKIGKLGLDKIAICGASKARTIIGQYLVKMGGMASYTKFTKTKKEALAWLAIGNTPRADISRRIRFVVALIVASLAVAVLVGWATDNTILKSIIPGLNSMNPVNAVNFLLLALMMVLFKRDMGKGRQLFVALVGAWCIVYGLAIIVRHAFGLDIPIDRWLFTQKLGLNDGVAPNASLDYLLIGGMILTLLTGQRHKWQRYLFHIFSVSLVVTTLGAIVGISLGLDSLYSGRFVPLALNTGLCFLFLNHGLFALSNPLKFFAVAWNATNRYWQAAVFVAAITFLVGFAWLLTTQDLRRNSLAAAKDSFTEANEAITDQLHASQNILRGYKGFFESSDTVSASEFQSFFLNSQPPGGYVSFTSVSFARSIPASQQAAFIADIKKQTGFVPAYAAYRVFPDTNSPTRYPLTYIEPHTNTSGFGFDLASDPVRRTALESARDSGQPAATESINLNASQGAGAPERMGFFVTIPIYKGETPTTAEARRAQIYGFVNTIFDYNQLFKETFKNVHTNSAQYVVSDTNTGKVIYTHNPDAPGVGTQPTMQETIGIGGQSWQLAIYTPPNFNAPALQQALPNLVLIGGGLLAALASALIITQARQRQNALGLATRMTEDLNNERNAAVSAKEKDDAILSSIGDAVFAINPKGNITLFNPVAEQLTGFSSNEALGKPYKDILNFVAEKDRTVSDSFIKSALKGHMANMKSRTKLVRKDGSEIYVADSAAPIHDAQKNIVGAIIVFRDITKEYELDKAKSEFVSLASHQLRTPLSAINWYAEMLLDGTLGKLNKNQLAQIQEIYGGNQRMIELVNSLLDVSRLDLGKLVNKPEPTDMTALATSLEKELATSIKGKSMTFTKQITASLPAVSADPKLLRMIVQNLLSNAVKYTPAKGTVTLIMRAASANEIKEQRIKSAGPHLFISVADTGYGIPAAQQGKIFQKMFRADNVQKLDVEGTGLGLYIVREVAVKLGGDVWFTSAEGKGTTFYVILPFTTKASRLSDSRS